MPFPPCQLGGLAFSFLWHLHWCKQPLACKISEKKHPDVSCNLQMHHFARQSGQRGARGGQRVCKRHLEQDVVQIYAAYVLQQWRGRHQHVQAQLIPMLCVLPIWRGRHLLVGGIIRVLGAAMVCWCLHPDTLVATRNERDGQHTNRQPFSRKVLLDGGQALPCACSVRFLLPKIPRVGARTASLGHKPSQRVRLF